MVIPVAEHRLIKIRKVNRIRLLRQALLASLAAVSINLIGSLTNSWLYTSEVLKYFVFPNISANFEDQLNTPVYLKNATLGPWKFCWEDPITAFFCEEVHYDRDDDAADVTSGIQQSTRKAVAFMLLGVLLDSLGFCSCVVCNCRANTYRTLFVSAVLLILAGIANFACIIVYMAAVSKEVGNKIYAASEMDEPLFHYDFGYSFIMINVSFLLTEVAALFSVVVFMAKRDERTFHRFKIRSLLSSAFVGNHISDLRMDCMSGSRYLRGRLGKCVESRRLGRRMQNPQPADSPTSYPPLNPLFHQHPTPTLNLSSFSDRSFGNVSEIHME